ncbi:response regulator transcription factor [Dactylosporangium darangshiense]|uniref:Response regulator transcription factor n=2 Tax=Dactylosporangium darangshiense TaxID=579108 RepID=A0ABP8DHZ9_9ACTN
MITIAIVEDDPVTRLGLAAIVDNETGMTAVASVASVEELEAKHLTAVDVILLDLYLRSSEFQGADAVKRLVERGHRVLVLSMSDEELAVQEAIGAGANGYLTKEAEPDEILRAARTVAGGKTYFSATVAGFLLRDAARLTAREVQILRLVASGDTTPEIAAQLVISEKTVNRHLERIRDKTGARRRADLTRFAIERGILSRFQRKPPRPH